MASEQPPYVGIDRELRRRPGVPQFREPRPWAYARWPITQQQGIPSVQSRHRPRTPVFSTALPPKGVSGQIRRFAYRIPDHRPIHWLLLMTGDRVEAMGRRSPFWLLPAAGLLLGGVWGFWERKR